MEFNSHMCQTVKLLTSFPFEMNSHTVSFVWFQLTWSADRYVHISVEQKIDSFELIKQEKATHSNTYKATIHYHLITVSIVCVCVCKIQRANTINNGILYTVQNRVILQTYFPLGIWLNGRIEFELKIYRSGTRVF